MTEVEKLQVRMRALEIAVTLQHPGTLTVQQLLENAKRVEQYLLGEKEKSN